MNVNFNSISGTESDFEKSAISMEAGGVYQVHSYKAEKTQNAIAVDIGGNLFNDNAYGMGAKTKNDIMAEAQNTEATVRHNYMSVMANTLSPEDFAKGAEEGFDLSETGADETVTILDKIKATLAQSGQEIIGFTDDLSSKQLEKITGSSGLAEQIMSSFHGNDIPVTSQNVNEVIETVDRMSEVTELDGEAVKFMTLNELTPTMDNLYLAMHASNGQKVNGGGFIPLEAGGYYAQKADNINWESIKDQVGKVIEEAGLPINEENDSRARWMVEESIPLTAENLKTVDALSKLKLPLENKEIIELAAKSISNKNTAAAGIITEENNNLKKASEIFEKTNVITDSDLEGVILKDKTLNLKNLFREHETNKPDNNELISNEPEKELRAVSLQEHTESNSQPGQEADIKLLTARKQLEEVRLQMSVTANLRLIDKGFSIETAPMSELISELSKEIESMGKILFPDSKTDDKILSSTDKYALFEETTAKIQNFKTYPLAVSGKIAPNDNRNLGSIIETGYQMKLRFEKAGVTYEALGTAPRADMGDSIKKAFQNVDDILKDLGQDITDENRRVVRILGYNRMEITPENIERVRTADEKLMNTIDRLKPSAVLNMIREDKNPLNMTLDELSNQLSEQEQENSKQEEKYAKFLYKLEKNNEITAEEKQSYIGIYRLFANLKNTDNAAIGAVLETGAEMTIRNLLSAQRTIKAQKSGMDIKIDDSLLSVEARSTETMTIDRQIDTAFLYYSQKADIVYNNLEPEKLKAARPTDETLLDDLADKLYEASEDIDTERLYYSEESRRVRNIVERSDAESVAKELSEYDIEISASNIEALVQLRLGRRGRHSVWDQAEKIAHLAFKETEQEMLDELGGVRDYGDSYAEHLAELSQQLSDMISESEQVESYIDVKAIHLMQKQISVATRMADKGSYEIPVEVDGRTVSMHVTLRDDRSEGTKMEASLETMDFGRVSMAMTIDEGEVKGIFASALSKNEELSEYINEVKNRFINELKANEPELIVESKNIGIMYHRSDVGSAIQGAEKGISDSRTLLRMAGIFVHSV